MAPGVLHLKEVATGRTVAKQEDPHGDRAGCMNFTPDGARLAVVAPYACAIHVWDLRAIRVRLKSMHLDWDWPEFPPAPTQENQPASLEITVDAGRLQVNVADGVKPAPFRFPDEESAPRL